MKCPYCSYESEKDQTSCPACGMIIQEYEETLQELDKFKTSESIEIAQPTPPKKKRRKGSFIIVFFSILILLLIIGAGAYQLGFIPKDTLAPLIAKVKQPSSKPEKTKPKEKKTEPVEIAKKTPEDRPFGQKKSVFDKVTKEIQTKVSQQEGEGRDKPTIPEKSQTPEEEQKKEVQPQVPVKEPVKEAPAPKPDTETKKPEKPAEPESLPFTAKEYATMGLEEANVGNIEKAREHFKNALTLSPDMPSIKAYGDVIDETLKHGGGKESLKYYFQAQEFDRKKQKIKAIEAYKKALDSYPDFPQPLYHVAMYYSDKKNLDKALPFLEKAAPHFPASEEVHYNLGMAYMDDKKWNDASEAFHKAGEINPKNFDSLYYLGVTSGLNEKWTDAIEALSKVLPHKSNKGEMHYYIALSYYYSGGYEQALKHCQQAGKYKYKVHPALLRLLEPYENK